MADAGDSLSGSLPPELGLNQCPSTCCWRGHLSVEQKAQTTKFSESLEVSHVFFQLLKEFIGVCAKYSLGHCVFFELDQELTG